MDVPNASLLRDGTSVVIDPCGPGDADDLAVLIDRLGPESRRLRFHSAGVRITPQHLVGGEETRAICARVRGELVGIASYTPLQEEGVAEMAVAVADDAQTRGLGTVLFERLADLARAEGIGRLLAVVMAENRGMLELLTGLGFATRRVAGRGEVEVHVDITRGTSFAGWVAALDRRRHAATAFSLQPLFEPAAVAVVGASRDRASIGNAILRNLLAGDYPGVIVPVNPNAAAVAGVAAVASVLDAPAQVDLAVICVPARAVDAAVDDCLRAGVRALVVISAGYAEASAEGRRAQERLAQRVRAAGARLVGPNCLGVLTNRAGLSVNATFAATLPPVGGVAVSSESGALGIAILEQARALGIGISAFASIGNRADVSANDILERFEDDPASRVIALYVESFGNPRRFVRIARRVAATKPIVCVKAGRGRAGARAASSHTAALAADDAVVDGLFRQAGVVRTQTLEELFDVVRLFDQQPLPAGGRVAVLTNAGGLGILCADACESAGLELPPLAPATTAALAELLPGAAATGNPVDMLAEADGERYRRSLRLLHDDPGIDAVIALHAATRTSASEAVAAGIRAAVDEGLEKPVLAGLVSGGGVPASLNPPDAARRIPAYAFPERAARALAHAAALAAFRRRPRGREPAYELDLAAARELCAAALVEQDEAWLPPADVERLLAAAGIRTPRSVVAATRADAMRAAATLTPPLAAKLVSPVLLHKTDVGGVALDLWTPDDVGAAWDRIAAAVAAAGRPDAFAGVHVQELLPPGVEILAGVEADAVFGRVLAVGVGGALAELVRDVAFRVCPVTDLDVEELLDRGRLRRLLAGVRGRPPADVPAVREAVLRLAQLADAVPAIVELELSPLVALPPGEGAYAVDARVRVSRSGLPAPPPPPAQTAWRMSASSSAVIRSSGCGAPKW